MYHHVNCILLGSTVRAQIMIFLNEKSKIFWVPRRVWEWYDWKWCLREEGL
jgi:hypothetical protein